uniref:Methanethiol oxidase n=1 Tax=Parastrongyloides trichosuri TaxID=131310 RepID=A0A0N4Z0N1_PARTI
MEENKKKCCLKNGPGYKSPEDAFKNGKKEHILFVTCPSIEKGGHDIIACVDVDPESKTYSNIISYVKLPNINDEVHHSGWNTCSSCFDDNTQTRSHLVIPCLNSSRIYVINTKDPKNLTIDFIVEPEELKPFNVSFPHTSHCLADGNIMISTLGDNDGEARGNFILLDGKTFKPKKTWIKENSKEPLFNYDFWYQPRHNVMISTEWGVPNNIKKGFKVEDVKNCKYGNKVHIFNWNEKTIRQSIELPGVEGQIPLEVRFLHEPSKAHAFVGTALGSSIFHIYDDNGKYKARLAASIEPVNVSGWGMNSMPALITDIIISMNDKYLRTTNATIIRQSIELPGVEGQIPLEVRFLHEPSKAHAFVGTALGSSIFHIYDDNGKYKARLAASIEPVNVSGWGMNSMSALITDIIISMNDKYLYASCWLHGIIKQYDISDPFNIILNSQINISGSFHKETNVKIIDKDYEQPNPTYIKETIIEGGPQMLQLSLDGKRLYVSNSLYLKWDQDFYPNLVSKGGNILKINIDDTNGTMTLDENFLVDLKNVDGLGYLAHEMRYPGGDCTSDIWL